ncbi:VanW family protein [Antrihabitans stalactiti]|uniref:VanW family protein n=1 Tax=Antrihabitans stalactiti TaxID=2584121 RepID=UPI0030B83C87
MAIILGAVFAVFALAYLVDWIASAGDVPRGTRVAGIDVGGMNADEAERVLRDRIGPRTDSPAAVQAGDVRAGVTPTSAGLSVDWDATLKRVRDQPINPLTRLFSPFTTRTVDVVSVVDDAALARSVDKLSAVIDRKPLEGSVRFEGAKPVGVTAVPGQVLDVAGAKAALIDEWANGTTIELPVDVVDVTVHDSAVDKAVAEVAGPAVAADVVFTGRDGKSATLKPDQVGAVLSFAPDGSGGLAPQYNRDAAAALLAPQLASTEVMPRDAEFAVDTGFVRVIPAVVGDMVVWPKTLDQLPALLSNSGPRTVAATYEAVQPAFTTAAADAFGIREVIAEYTTGGFEYASGVNIRKVAEVVNRAIVKPGDTFSLNGFTGPRGTDQGYIESGIIDHGRPARAVGGGISQFATTLYNAAYFAGLEDVDHTEHSYYISRYPEAREATVYEGAIDLQFRNNTPTGILIETVATGSDVTVRIWGTKAVEVESVTGDRYAQTAPRTITLPKGDDCVASKGAPGFTTSNTRIITDRITRQEVYRHTRTVKYDPVPIVKCE